jgi:hypothetical protein
MRPIGRAVRCDQFSCKFPQCQYWDQLVPVNGPKSELGEKGEHGNLFSQRGLSVGGDKLNPWSTGEIISLAHQLANYSLS